MFEDLIVGNLMEARELLDRIVCDSQLIAAVNLAAEVMGRAVMDGKKIVSCGNGGSMCDAMHFAEELTGRFRDERRAIPAIAIADPSHITCVANDYGYDYIFSRYLEALGNEGDVFLAISTSGNSKNILVAAEAAKKKGMKVVGLTGKSGGLLADWCDVEMRVPHFGYSDRVQEVHIKLIHTLIQCIELFLSKQ